MKVLVVGANGQIGKDLVAMIQAKGRWQARAMIRKEEQTAYFKELGAETVLVDLEDNIDVIQQAMNGVDAVVFTAGSGPHTGSDKTLMIDLDGAVKTIIATEQAKLNRFIMISSYDTTREAIQSSSSSFAPYVVAKHYADEKLRETALDYTIIHPGLLTNEEATGKVKASAKINDKKIDIPRQDVAKVILTCLENDNTIGKEFQVISGDHNIQDAISTL